MSKSARHLYVKKRLMFNKEDDYYFITYNLVTILSFLKCVSENARFIDYTKLAYIIPFVSNRNELQILSTYSSIKGKPGNDETILLTDAYLNARLRTKVLSSLLVALEQRGLVHLCKNGAKRTIDVYLGEVPNVLLNSTLFESEIACCSILKQLVPKIRTVSKATLVNRLYGDMGVLVWDD